MVTAPSGGAPRSPLRSPITITARLQERLVADATRAVLRSPDLAATWCIVVLVVGSAVLIGSSGWTAAAGVAAVLGTLSTIRALVVTRLRVRREFATGRTFAASIATTVPRRYISCRITPDSVILRSRRRWYARARTVLLPAGIFTTTDLAELRRAARRRF